MDLKRPWIMQDGTSPLVRGVDRRKGKSQNDGFLTRYPLALDHTDVTAAEVFGVLRSRLLRVHLKSGIKTILVTSPGIKEGKSLSSVNLGLSFGQLAHKRVLLVDGDLRVSGATHMLEFESLPGLGDFLLGEKPYEEVVHPSSFPSLSIVPAGNVPPKSLPELLESSRWQEFVETSKQKFDLIIVDSVPMGAPLADLELLLAPCDALLLVVHLWRTTRESLVRAQAKIDRRKLLGVLINNAAIAPSYSGYYYPNPK